MSDIKEAIELRCSRRAYLPSPIEKDKAAKLLTAINTLNADYGINMQLVLNNGEAFKRLNKAYGMFSGVGNYIAMIGSSKDRDRLEKLGYCGELVTLLAVSMGLGACWVGASYDKELCARGLSEGEVLECVITVGNAKPLPTTREKLIGRVTHRKSKELKDIIETDEPSLKRLPEWFINGAKAVLKAPSAMNRQPVRLHYIDGITTASVETNSDYELIDLGIAKLHFEIGAGCGNWSLGNGAGFRYGG